MGDTFGKITRVEVMNFGRRFQQGEKVTFGQKKYSVLQDPTDSLVAMKPEDKISLSPLDGMGGIIEVPRRDLNRENPLNLQGVGSKSKATSPEISISRVKPEPQHEEPLSEPRVEKPIKRIEPLEPPEQETKLQFFVEAQSVLWNKKYYEVVSDDIPVPHISAEDVIELRSFEAGTDNIFVNRGELSKSNVLPK